MCEKNKKIDDNFDFIKWYDEFINEGPKLADLEVKILKRVFYKVEGTDKYIIKLE